MAVHKAPSAERVADAPFSFVPLPEAVFEPQKADPKSKSPDFDQYYPDRHSGVIELKIVAETPLFVRCAPPVADAKEEDPCKNPARQQFFHHGDKTHPVIPGSSLRGMARNLVEVLSSGKMQWFSDRHLIFRAVGDTSSLGDTYRSQLLGRDLNNGHRPQTYDYPSPNVHGGYLEKVPNGYAIRPAQAPDGESFVHVEYHHVPRVITGKQDIFDVYIKAPKERKLTHNRGRAGVDLWIVVAETVQREPDKGLSHAKLVVSGHMGNQKNPRPHDKHMHCAVYDPDPDPSKRIPIPKEMWEQYEEDAGIRRSSDRQPRPLHPEEPLFYLLNERNELVFFGPTMMFRIPYQLSIGAFAPARLRAAETEDLAEQLFGIVRNTDHGPRPAERASEQKAQSVRGRLAFEDAVWVETTGSPFFGDNEGLVTPTILGTPKATAFQEYLTQDQPNKKEELRHYGSNPQLTEIRGHKFYWHKTFDPRKYWEDRVIANDKQHTVIRPVVPNTQFKGRVHFENLSSLELGALLTALQLPPSLRHKIGMGKPLGMGTVRIEADLCLVNRTQRYSRLLTEDGRFETGEYSGGEADEVRSQAVAAFRVAMIDHHNEHAGNDRLAPESALWSIPRLQELATLLEWDPQRSDRRFDYPSPAPSGGIDGKYWRERRVVPTPACLIGLVRGSGRTSSPANPGFGRGAVSGTTRSMPAPPARERNVDHGVGGGSTRVGQEALGRLLETKTKKGRWRAKLDSGETGVIVDSDRVPTELKPNDAVVVRVKSASMADSIFEFVHAGL